MVYNDAFFGVSIYSYQWYAIISYNICVVGSIFGIYGLAVYTAKNQKDFDA